MYILCVRNVTVKKHTIFPDRTKRKHAVDIILR